MQIIRLAYHYFIYRLKSFRLHGVHSPFVFDLYEHVIRHDGHYPAYAAVEALRARLLKDSTSIAVTDFGAGSRTKTTALRQIKAIARVSAKPPKYGQLLFRLANYFQPATIVELGTSLGLTTAYLGFARQQAQVYSIEGCPNLADQARKNLQGLKLKHVAIEVGNIDQVLPRLMQEVTAADFVFFDGNHRYEPTLQYFRTCLEKRTEDSIFIFDDIYWSEEMLRAWREIIRHPEVTLSIDLFQIGLVFFRTKQPKQHFTLWF